MGLLILILMIFWIIWAGPMLCKVKFIRLKIKMEILAFSELIQSHWFKDSELFFIIKYYHFYSFHIHFPQYLFEKRRKSLKCSFIVID